MGIADWISSFSSSNTVHCDSAEPEAQQENAPQEEEASTEPAAAEEEEEEEEPEDEHPAIREECQNSAACAAATKHFQHCNDRVNEGKAQFHGEDCVEEMFHMMHCADECAAPKLFAKLK
ncbi:Non-heme 11 kDa protein of cytochrome bc1 complex [Flagelloscypha sp. PMI_526]|nr:Non-heme 11 kDa protein of cytochrome bc1 complex [Flagelloscypha sp. PMI_526]